MSLDKFIVEDVLQDDRHKKGLCTLHRQGPMIAFRDNAIHGLLLPGHGGRGGRGFQVPLYVECSATKVLLSLTTYGMLCGQVPAAALQGLRVKKIV
jgi:hypothetical protein